MHSLCQIKLVLTKLWSTDELKYIQYDLDLFQITLDEQNDPPSGCGIKCIYIYTIKGLSTYLYNKFIEKTFDQIK